MTFLTTEREEYTRARLRQPRTPDLPSPARYTPSLATALAANVGLNPPLVGSTGATSSSFRERWLMIGRLENRLRLSRVLFAALSIAPAIAAFPSVAAAQTHQVIFVTSTDAFI